MTTSISHSMISVLTQAARGQQSGPVQLPAATIRSLPKGRYFVSAFRLDVKVPVSVLVRDSLSSTISMNS